MSNGRASATALSRSQIRQTEQLFRSRVTDRNFCSRASLNQLDYDMEFYKTELERAFEMARSGQHPDIASILKHLKSEGYSGHQVEGKSLKMQLALLIEQALQSHQV